MAGILRPLTPWTWRRLAALTLSIGLAGCGSATRTSPPQHLLAQGWEDYRLGEFNRAAAAFEAVVAQTGEGETLHQEGLYGLASVWQWRDTGNRPDKARVLFEKVIALNPQSDLAAWSQLALARMEHLTPPGKEPDYPSVRAAYQRVIDAFPQHAAAEEALIYQQATLAATLRPADAATAAAVLEGYVRSHGEGRFRSAAWSLLAACYGTLHEPEKRLAALIESLKAEEIDPRNPEADHAWAYWNIATVAEFEAGDFAAARAYYRRIIEEYPADVRVYGSRQALRRMALTETELRRQATAGGADERGQP